jgi:hypothetical protein
MLSNVREFLGTKTGQGVAIAGAAAAVILAVFVLKNAIGGGPAVNLSRARVYVCSETGKSFEHEIKMGERNPIYSPHSGKNTGWPAESCYWTKDGKIKQEPTYILLNEYAKKPGPTFCPECGRLVMPLNPPPMPGSKPPPTQAEFKQTRGRLEQ